MLTQNRIRLLTATLLLLAASLCFSSSALAQAPTPSPTPAAANGGGRTFSEHIAGLSIRASQLLPALDYEVISRLMTWAERISILLAAVVMLFSFMRVWRESEGGGGNLLFLFLRYLVLLMILGSSVLIVEHLHSVGKWIAEGDEIQGSGGNSMLFEFYRAQRESFNDSYDKFTQGLFTVKVDGRDFNVKPNLGGDMFLGVVYDSQTSVRDIASKMNDSSWTLPTLFSWLNVSRGIIETGGFWLIGLGGFLLIVAKIVAPFMVVLALDQKLAHKVTYPYLWGVLVLTLIFPAVTYGLSAIAYLIGNVAMGLPDAEPLYIWDYATLTAIRSPLAQPAYTVGFAAFWMTIVGASLWVSPYIAYRISMGQMYEGVSSTMSAWAGAIVGTGLEAYSASAAAAVNNQAANTQIQGSFNATRAEATANRDAGKLRNQAAFITGRASALSAAQATAGAAMAAGRAGMSQAYTMFGSARSGTAGYNERTANLTRDRQIADNNTMSGRQASEINTDSQVARKGEWEKAANSAPLGLGGGIALLGKGGSGVVSTLSDGKYGATPITLHQRGYDSARGTYTTNVNQNAQLFAEQTAILNRQTGDQMAGISMQQAREAAGAAYVAAGTAISGHGQALGLSNRASDKEFTGRMKGAEITRAASTEAARLQAWSSVMSSVGSKIARDIQEGMELHY